MLTVTQHLAHHRLPLLSMEPETRKNDQDFSFRCPSDPCACESRSRAFLNLSESARSISRCISSAVRVWPFACLNSTLSRIARSATSSAMTAWPVPPGSRAFGSCPFTLASKVSLHHSLGVSPRSLAAASSCANSSSLTFVLRVLVRSGGFTTRHHHGKQPIAKGGSPLGSPLFSRNQSPPWCAKGIN